MKASRHFPFGVGLINTFGSIIFIYFLQFNQSPFQIFGSPWLLTITISLLIILTELLRSRSLATNKIFLFVFIGLWLAYSLFQLLIISRIGMHIEFLTYQLTFFLISTAFCFFINRLKRPDYFFIILLSSWLVMSYVALYWYLTKIVEYSIVSGFGGVLVDRNNFAVHTVIFAFLVSVYCKNLLLTTIYVTLSCIIIFYTASITGILACVVLILYQLTKLKLQTRLIIAIFGAVISSTILFIMRQNLQIFLEKFSDIFAVLIGSDPTNSSISSRSWLIEQGATLWGRFPVFGAGLGNTQLYIIKPGRVGQGGMNTHNNYLEILATTGIIGFLLHYGLLLFLLVATSRHHKYSHVKYAIYLYGIVSIAFITTNHFITMYIFVFILISTFTQTNYRAIDKGATL